MEGILREPGTLDGLPATCCRTVFFYSQTQFILSELSDQPGCRALLLVTPEDSPEEVEAQIISGKYSGFKVYHVYASRKNTLEAEPQEYIPEWVWELSNRYSLAIMLHMVRARAMADPINQSYIREHCLQYPNAKLILAHAARGFCGNHTTEGIASLRGLDNVFFDTSAVCESQPFEAILREFGTSRLMFGTDFSVSEIFGRCVSIGDGFLWLGEENVNWESTTFARPVRVGLESLLAIKQACHTLRLNDADVERIFCHNARAMLGISSGSTSNITQETYKRAKQLIPGGTQLLSKRPEMFAPDCWPAYYREASGCEVIDLDGKTYHDLATSGIGSCLLGYRDPDVTDAVVRRVQLGSMSSLNSPEEVELAALLTSLHPWPASVAPVGNRWPSRSALPARKRDATKSPCAAIMAGATGTSPQICHENRANPLLRSTSIFCPAWIQRACPQVCLKRHIPSPIMTLMG